MFLFFNCFFFIEIYYARKGREKKSAVPVMENGKCMYSNALSLSIFIEVVGFKMRAINIKMLKNGSININM